MSDVNEGSVTGLLKAGVTAWALGKHVNMRVRATGHQLAAITEALDATHAFDDELVSESATVESVLEKLETKRRAAESFQRHCGVAWPL